MSVIPKLIMMEMLGLQWAKVSSAEDPNFEF
jgi:hypothetical protein